MTRFLSLFQRRPARPPLPFRPYYGELLIPEDARRAFHGREHDPLVRALFELLEEKLYEETIAMSEGKADARGAWRALESLHGEISRRVRRE